MFRSLILLSAMCVLLLIGYIAMGKGNFTKSHEAVSVSKKEPTSEVTEEPEHKTEIDSALESSKDAAKTIIKDASTSLKEMITPQKERGPKDINVETDDIENTLSYAQKENDAHPQVYADKDRWAVLSETQEVLSNVGEILK